MAKARAARFALAASLLCLATTACSGVTPGVRPGVSVGPTGSLTIVAAGAVTDILTRLGNDYSKTNPLLRVSVRPVASPPEPIAGTDVVAGEGVSLAPIMEALASPPVLFARDQLVIAVAPGNPKQLVSLADLTQADVRVAVCADKEPCGAAAEQVLTAAQVALTPAVRPADVKAAIADVVAGRADAALVYRSDTRAASDSVATVEFPQSRQAVAEYRIAALRTSPNPTAAQGFIDFVTSSTAADTLASSGYQPP